MYLLDDGIVREGKAERPGSRAIRWRHVSLNAAAGRDRGGRSASSRSFRCHGRGYGDLGRTFYSGQGVNHGPHLVGVGARP